MSVLNELLLFIGGITVFLLGLTDISRGVSGFAKEKTKRLLSKCSSNPIRGLLTGATVTAVAQSSIAVNIVAIGFVDSGMLTFYSAAAIIMGANIGTTVTAQIVSLSGITSFDITAVGSLAAFIGFAVSFFSKKANNKTIGDVLIGFGLIFIGLEIMSQSVEFFNGYKAFQNIFLIDNPLVLFLNGIAVTAVMQSSSAVTSVMILLASGGVLSFNNAIFIILGANVGTCLPVIVSALGKSDAARRAAVFNLAFNLYGAALFFIPAIAWGNQISAIFTASHSIGRAIANFHTVFNLITAIATLPLLRPFSELSAKKSLKAG